MSTVYIICVLCTVCSYSICTQYTIVYNLVINCKIKDYYFPCDNNNQTTACILYKNQIKKGNINVPVLFSANFEFWILPVIYTGTQYIFLAYYRLQAQVLLKSNYTYCTGIKYLIMLCYYSSSTLRPSEWLSMR